MLVFAGPDPLSYKNYWDEMVILQQKYDSCPGCKVHTGFYKSFVGAEDKVLYAWDILRKSHPEAKTAVVGHSFGAALAVHGAIALKEKRGMPFISRSLHAPSPKQRAVTSPDSPIADAPALHSISLAEEHLDLLYNFGQPRVGNQKFASWYNETITDGKQFRITHHKVSARRGIANSSRSSRSSARAVRVTLLAILPPRTRCHRCRRRPSASTTSPPKSTTTNSTTTTRSATALARTPSAPTSGS
mmetsp:Transcript_1973/g.5859  ORF Transcript_1973/g.5859 Transcript_1973/m.5859 type:complete len:245 (+) Transcript_1973:831-1565(+)